MKLIVLRHGETDWNVEKRIQGQRDVSINRKGREQIRKTCELLAKVNITYIVTSPLRRALESARTCARELGIPMMIHPGFTERSFGCLEGLTTDEISEAYGISDLEEMDDPKYGIESFESLAKRINQGLLELTSQFLCQTVLLVTHGSIIKHMGSMRGLHTGIVKNGAYLEMPVGRRWGEVLLCRKEL